VLFHVITKSKRWVAAVQVRGWLNHLTTSASFGSRTKILAKHACDFLRARMADSSLAPEQRPVNHSVAAGIGVLIVPVREAIY